MTLQEAMKQSEYNSATTRDSLGFLTVDGRCANDGDFWTIREWRITNRHYSSLDDLVEAEVSHSHEWRSFAFASDEDESEEE